jgi:tripartite-type tricarboxylate transporter receptor subunit TctC
MPPAMVDKLSGLLKQALESEALKEAFDKQGAQRIWLSPADTAKYRAANEAKLAPVIKASGAKVE